MNMDNESTNPNRVFYDLIDESEYHWDELCRSFPHCETIVKDVCRTLQAKYHVSLYSSVESKPIQVDGMRIVIILLVRTLGYDIVARIGRQPVQMAEIANAVIHHLSFIRYGSINPVLFVWSIVVEHLAMFHGPTKYHEAIQIVIRTLGISEDVFSGFNSAFMDALLQRQFVVH